MNTKSIAILQSCYIPWKGYFDIINSVDEFIVFDTAQYTKRDWRNRNCIKTPTGPLWLTIPVTVKGKSKQSIADAMISDATWVQKHWRSIERNYSKSPCFHLYSDLMHQAYLSCMSKNKLSDVNVAFIHLICDILKIKTLIAMSHQYETSAPSNKTQRLIDICKQANAARYVSGPLARDYIDEQLFSQNGIELSYFDYSGYSTYHQPHGDFMHEVSIIDLLFNEGSNSRNCMKSFLE